MPPGLDTKSRPASAGAELKAKSGQLDASIASPTDKADQTILHDEDQDRPSGPISGIEPEGLKNYVNNDDLLDDIQQTYLTYVKFARDNRWSKVEQDWIRYRDIYNLRRLVSYYQGRSRLFLPATKKAIDVLVRVAKDALFSDPYIGIETNIPKYKDQALDLMTWLLEDQGKLREKTSQFLRQLYIVGTSCLKVSWVKRKRSVKYREYDSDINRTTVKTRQEYDHYGPKFEVVDMRHVYVWPETATDFDSARLVFEDSTITVAELREKAKDGLYDADRVESAILRRSQQLELERLADSQAVREQLSEPLILPRDVLDITYIWAKFKLPGQDAPQWNQIVQLNDNMSDVVRIAENPWWFQKPNYLFGTLFQEHDYFYGHGIIEMLEMWQYMLNDVANQTMDTATYTLNPIVAYDPGAIDDPDQLELQPMARWPIPPKDVNIMRPPMDLAQQGVSMMQFLMNIIQESSDATALVQGAPRVGLGKATSTATGVSQLFSSSHNAIIDQVSSLQTQVFTPLVQYVEIMAHEFMDEDMAIRKLGADGVVITQRIIRPQDLVLSTDVRWVASIRLREKSVKVQQLLNFVNITSKIPPQVTMQQGFMINLKEIAKDLYSGLGLPNADRIIIDIMNSLPGIPAELEHQLLESGQSVKASPVDTIANHERHLMDHMRYKPASELVRVRILEHIASHYQAIQQGQAMAQQLSQQSGKGGPGTAMQLPGPGGRGVGMRPQEMAQSEESSDTLAGVLGQLGQG